MKIIRSDRKTLAIYVRRQGQIEVRAPQRLSLADIERFVAKKQAWIRSKQKQLQSLPERIAVEYTDGSYHYYLGEAHKLCVTSVRRMAAQAGIFDADHKEIQLVTQGRKAAQIEAALNRWYRQRAEELFTQRYGFWVDALSGFKLPRSGLRLRKMKRRWGSCSQSGVITLNTQLIRYPLECIDGVIVHELCHLLEFNHSPRFYALLDQAYPHWRAIDARLNHLSHQY